MSFGDYVRHIKLKYSLAAAIAVIKSKPPTLTIEEYITSLRNKLTSGDQMDIDLDFDFNMNDEFMPQSIGNEASVSQSELSRQEINPSPTILRDFDPRNMLHRNSEGDGQPVYSIVEALQLLQEMETDLPAVVENTQNVLRLPNPVELASQNMTIETQEIYFDNDTEMKEKTNYLRKTITSFVNHMETVNNTQASNVCNVQINKEKNTSSIARNVNRDGNLSQIENRLQSQEIDSQETQLYSLSDYTQNTHYSQSQTEDNRFARLDKYLTSYCKPSNQTTVEKNSETLKTIDNIQEVAKVNNRFNDTHYDYLSTGFEGDKPKVNRDIVDKENTAKHGHHSKLIDIIPLAENRANTKEIESECCEIITDIPSTSQNFEVPRQYDTEDEVFDSQLETIPFKVIEELNKVKTTFNRRNERRISTESYSTDSGYSDSQKSLRSGKNSLGLSSGNRLNQSAHSLLNYLLSCPLNSNTSEITKEISQVLGELADALHSEQKYPSFLDAVLESIDSLLENLAGGEICGEIVMAKKDEDVQRILFLNRSVHIIASTVEKITTKLEHLHEQLTDEEELYEMTDVQSVENTVFLFHILETLLQRYVKKKLLLSSQSSSQLSDDEILPKRSSITEIWKQKWDPEFKKKDSISSPRTDEKILETKVGEVMNKLVIDCMEEYSLISFAALQCFNVLQY